MPMHSAELTKMLTDAGYGMVSLEVSRGFSLVGARAYNTTPLLLRAKAVGISHQICWIVIPVASVMKPIVTRSIEPSLDTFAMVALPS